MLELLRGAIVDIAAFLEEQLPQFSDNWWQSHVIGRLTYQQQRLTTERSITSLSQLDLAALLRVMDENWYQISSALQWPREGRNWIKELQSIRNKWAHLSAEDAPANELYRDADTLDQLLRLIGARTQMIAAVNDVKRRALRALATAEEPTATPLSGSSAKAVDDESPSLFSPGDIVSLRADQAKRVAVVAVTRSA
jgi:hypothetical protein